MENIEAMLCGYIEGDLDDAARAQIEKHLQENPQHRKLIDDLLATRDLVKSLPRVRAPMDVGDSLRGQVERSILLDDASLSAAPRETISRLPHVMAVAAIFLLCAALFLILYKALGPTFKPPTYTESTPPKIQPITEAATPAQSSDSLAGQPQPAPTFNRQADSAKAPVEINQNPATDSSASEVAGLPAQFNLPALRGRLAGAGYALTSSESAAPLVLVVQGDDPKATSAEVADLLNTAGVNWSRVPPTPSPTPALPVVATSVNQNQVGVKQADQIATTQVFQAMSLSSASIKQETGITPTAQQQYKAIATTQSASVGQTAPPPSTPITQFASAQNDGTKKEEVQKGNVRKDDQAAILPSAEIYVLHGLTADQATVLRKNIATADDVDTLYVQDSVPTATTQPTAIAAIENGTLQSEKFSLRSIAPSGKVAGVGGASLPSPTTSPSPLAFAASNAPSNTASNSATNAEMLNDALAPGSLLDARIPNKPLATVDAVIIVESSPPEPAATQPSMPASPSLNPTGPTTAPTDAPPAATQP